MHSIVHDTSLPLVSLFIKQKRASSHFRENKMARSSKIIYKQKKNSRPHVQVGAINEICGNREKQVAPSIFLRTKKLREVKRKKERWHGCKSNSQDRIRNTHNPQNRRQVLSCKTRGAGDRWCTLVVVLSIPPNDVRTPIGGAGKEEEVRELREKRQLRPKTVHAFARAALRTLENIFDTLRSESLRGPRTEK